MLGAVLAAILNHGPLHGQTADSTPSAAIVSPSTPTEGIQPANVQPGTSAIKETENSIVADPASLLPDLPPVPQKNATLVGGTLEHLDRVRDQLTIRVFGGGKTTALFDPRTHVFRGTKEVTVADLREGDRIYLDTILDGKTVFARNIRLSASSVIGEGQGVVLKFQGDELSLRDGLAPSAVRVRIDSGTKFLQNGRAIPASRIVPGTLIAVHFSPDGNRREVAREITVLALAGTRYTFVGQVVHIDLRTGLLVLNSSIDHKTYELYLDPATVPSDGLQPGATVTVTASYQNSRYEARSMTVDSQSK